MFPLGTVLFPGMPLRLHVFEPRYRALVRDALAAGGEFGVVLIERGSEVGGGDTRFGVGTIARLADVAVLPDGRSLLLAMGTTRFRVSRWLPDRPYPYAEIDDLPDSPESVTATVLDTATIDTATIDTAAIERARRSLERVLALGAALGDHPAVAVPPTADSALAAFVLAGSAPLGPLDQQRVLEAGDPVARLTLVHVLLDECAEVLDHRLRGA
jgi:Lon protease-like protein